MQSTVRDLNYYGQGDDTYVVQLIIWACAVQSQTMFAGLSL